MAPPTRVTLCGVSAKNKQTQAGASGTSGAPIKAVSVGGRSCEP